MKTQIKNNTYIIPQKNSTKYISYCIDKNVKYELEISILNKKPLAFTKILDLLYEQYLEAKEYEI